MKLDERLRRRRCLGLQVAAVLGVILAVNARADPVLLVAALAGIGLVVLVLLRDCREIGTKRAPNARSRSLVSRAWRRRGR
jgi:hypothetical protein